MKRPGLVSKRYLRTGIIDQDLTTDQLAGIGRIALAYNEAEVMIHIAFNACLGIEEPLIPHVAPRIYGIDGHIDIILTALKCIDCAPDVLEVIRSILGEGEFKLLKKYRDAVVHARVKNAATGVAVGPFKKGKIDEVLLSKKALDGLYGRLDLIKLELLDIAAIAAILGNASRVRRYGHSKLIAELTGVGDLAEKNVVDQTNADVRERWTRCLEHRGRRLGLPPLPDFPD